MATYFTAHDTPARAHTTQTLNRVEYQSCGLDMIKRRVFSEALKDWMASSLNDALGKNIPEGGSSWMDVMGESVKLGVCTLCFAEIFCGAGYGVASIVSAHTEQMGGGGGGGAHTHTHKRYPFYKRLSVCVPLLRACVPPVCVCQSNSKHWFTTSFLGGRCRKAMLGVCVCVMCGRVPPRQAAPPPLCSFIYNWPHFQSLCHLNWSEVLTHTVSVMATYLTAHDTPARAHTTQTLNR